MDYVTVRSPIKPAFAMQETIGFQVVIVANIPNITHCIYYLLLINSNITSRFKAAKVIETINILKALFNVYVLFY
jgi:hypothetical protein